MYVLSIPDTVCTVPTVQYVRLCTYLKAVALEVNLPVLRLPGTALGKSTNLENQYFVSTSLA